MPDGKSQRELACQTRFEILRENILRVKSFVGEDKFDAKLKGLFLTAEEGVNEGSVIELATRRYKTLCDVKRWMEEIVLVPFTDNRFPPLLDKLPELLRDVRIAVRVNQEGS